MIMVMDDETPPSPTFERFDAQVAAGLRDLPDDVGGLPGYLGLRHVEVGPGRLRAEVDVREELKTPFGNLHGGVLAALCDHVLGTVCYPVIPRGAWAATTEFKLNYLVPVTTGTLSATARIVSLTKRTAVVRIDVVNEGRLACAAQGTVLVMVPATTS
jgi:1,4-dihydroxy-2-naphthoyl-CoA hydrolase